MRARIASLVLMVTSVFLQKNFPVDQVCGRRHVAVLHNPRDHMVLGQRHEQDSLWRSVTATATVQLNVVTARIIERLLAFSAMRTTKTIARDAERRLMPMFDTETNTRTQGVTRDPRGRDPDCLPREIPETEAVPHKNRIHDLVIWFVRCRSLSSSKMPNQRCGMKVKTNPLDSLDPPPEQVLSP